MKRGGRIPRRKRHIYLSDLKVDRSRAALDDLWKINVSQFEIFRKIIAAETGTSDEQCAQIGNF